MLLSVLIPSGHTFRADSNSKSSVAHSLQRQWLFAPKCATQRESKRLVHATRARQILTALIRSLRTAVAVGVSDRSASGVAVFAFDSLPARSDADAGFGEGEMGCPGALSRDAIIVVAASCTASPLSLVV